MSGTPSQIEWADRIKPLVNAEFDRVAKAIRDVARRQPEHQRAETLSVVDILEEKRDETMAHDEAGYFIREWRELNDQVRQIIARDPRYQAIKARRAPSAV